MSTEAPEKPRNDLEDGEHKPRFGYSGSPEDIKQKQQPGSSESTDELEKSFAAPSFDPGPPEKRFSKNRLEEKEREPNRDTLDGLADQEREALGISAQSTQQSLYSGEEKPSFLTRFRGRLSRRRVAGFVAAGVLGFGGVGIFSIAQGPLQAIHLAEIFAKSFNNTNDTVGIRTQGFYRYWKSGDIGETRLGFMESKMNKKIQADLKEAGITVRTNASGQPQFIDIDPRSNPELRKLSPEDAKARVVQDFGVDENKVRITGNGRITVDASGSKIGAKRGFIYKSLGLAYKSKVRVGLTGRIVTKYFNTPSLFHPMRKVEAKLNEKQAELIRKRRAASEEGRQISEKEARRQANIEKYQKMFAPSDTVQPKIDRIKNALGSKSDVLRAGSGGAAGTLAIAGAICFANDLVGDVPEVNRATGAIPAVVAVGGALGHGGQTKSGEDFTSRQLGDYISTLYDDQGRSVFQSKEVNYLASGVAKGVEALPSSVTQAFAPDRSTDFIQEALDAAQADAICSPFGQVVQFAVGSVLLVTTGGAGTLLVKTATGAATAAALFQLLSYLKDYVVDKPLYEEVAKGGPLAGGIMAYGAEEFDGIVSRSMGGVAFTDDQSANIRSAIINEERDEFQEKSLATRIFDIKDYRSASARTFNGIDTGALQNPTSSIASSLKPNTWLSGFGAIFSGTVSAQEQDLRFTVPKYGFSKKLLENPNYQDWRENERLVKDLLDNGNDEYKDRANTCFGAEFTNGANGWEVVSQKDVNPAEDSYKDASCADESDDNWNRLRLYLLDFKAMESFVCHEGQSEDAETKKSCQNLGIGTAALSTPTESQVAGDPKMNEIITVKNGGKFITLPAKYSCPGRTTQIDARVAPALTYILETYNMCADDGLANGHRSHGAGLGVDIRPKDQSNQKSQEEWKNTAEAFLRDINWWGDSADEPKSSKGCANYQGYGSCVGGASGPNGKIPTWVRWIGYNGDVDHGDPWHVFGGSYAHIHLGWDTPNNDGVSPNIISTPREAVYTFPAPIAEDIKPLLPSELLKSSNESQ